MAENSQHICFVTTSDYGLMMPIVAKVKKTEILFCAVISLIVVLSLSINFH